MEPITVQTTIKSPVTKVWDIFNTPEHINKWNSALEEWRTLRAENDLKVGGKLSYRMEAKDGSAGFDFGATYTEVVPMKKIAYTIGDGRKVVVTFEEKSSETTVTETFDPEKVNLDWMQRAGWQAILDNLRKYTESI
jgi:uncharacterized protein YndB with AHSA1/START domain